MSRLLVFSVLIVLMLSGCVAGPTPTPQGIIDAGYELAREKMYIELTQQSVDSARIEMGAKMTATQMVLDATATQQMRDENAQATRQSGQATQAAWQVTVDAGKAYDAATLQAASAHGTATAIVQGTATQMAVLGTTATVQAAATATAVEMTVQAPVMAAKATAMGIEIKNAEMEYDKAAARFWLDTYGPWVLVVVLVAALAFYLWKKGQVGVIQDRDGNVRALTIGQNVLNLALMLRPLLTVSKDGFDFPQLVPDEMQNRQAHERNIVDAVEALGPGYGRPALGLAGSLTGPQQAGSVNIQVVQPGQVQPWIDDVQGQISEHVEED